MENSYFDIYTLSIRPFTQKINTLSNYNLHLISYQKRPIHNAYLVPLVLPLNQVFHDFSMGHRPH
jgi:hypothetical protein